MAEFEGGNHGAAGDFVGGVHLTRGAVGEGVFDLERVRKGWRIEGWALWGGRGE